jgi:hypothetical protein
MNRDLLDKARLAADYFLEAVDNLTTKQRLQELLDGSPYYDGGKLTAAVRRKSMDLTRALSALRQGRED